MTVKEIADKYHVPYSLVYEATGGVKVCDSYLRNREYPEKEVVHNIKTLLRQRIDRRQKYVDEANKMLAYIRWREVK